MAFSDNEKLVASDKLNQQLLNTGVNKFWYSELYPWSPSVDPSKIWLSFSDIPAVFNPTQANQAVIDNPTILEKRKIRLTSELTSNYTAYLARTLFNNNTSTILTNWVQPSLIQGNGGPSNGYIIKLFHGDPDLGGVEITTIFHSASGGAPCWSFSYSGGILFISTDESTYFRDNFYNVNGLYLVGYRYIGLTVQDGLVSSEEATKIVKVYNCETSAAIGDPVYYDLDNPQKVLVPTTNSGENPMIGIIESKLTPTTCKVLTHGYSSVTFTGLQKNKNVFLSTTGTLTNTLPSTGWMQIIGNGYENNQLYVNINLQFTFLG